MLNVCDLSSNNSINTIKRAIAENDAVIVKSSEGANYKNPYFSYTCARTVNEGKKLGVYHYARPENNSVEKEVFNFLRVAAPYIGESILILDWEGNALNQPSDWARKWLDLVYNITGVKPIIYVQESAINKVAPIASGDYGLWVAKYSKKQPKIQPWKVKAMWQYTANPYDKSYFYGDAKAWDAYAKRE